MAHTRAATLQKFVRLMHRAEMKQLEDNMSKVSMETSRATVEYFNLESRDGELRIPDAAEVKNFIQESLPPSMILLGEKFFIMPPIQIKILKEVADLFGCGMIDAAFMGDLHIDTTEYLSGIISTIVWLTSVSYTHLTLPTILLV